MFFNTTEEADTATSLCVDDSNTRRKPSIPVVYFVPSLHAAEISVDAAEWSRQGNSLLSCWGFRLSALDLTVDAAVEVAYSRAVHGTVEETKLEWPAG